MSYFIGNTGGNELNIDDFKNKIKSLQTYIDTIDGRIVAVGENVALNSTADLVDIINAFYNLSVDFEALRMKASLRWARTYPDGVVGVFQYTNPLNLNSGYHITYHNGIQSYGSFYITRNQLDTKFFAMANIQMTAEMTETPMLEPTINLYIEETTTGLKSPTVIYKKKNHRTSICLTGTFDIPPHTGGYNTNMDYHFVIKAFTSYPSAGTLNIYVNDLTIYEINYNITL